MFVEPIKEQILFDNLDIISFDQLEKDINYNHNLFNIYSDEEINSIKMSEVKMLNTSYSSQKSTNTKIEDKEQIDEVKYNVFFIIFNKCKFDVNIYNEIIKGRNILAKRLVIIDNPQNNSQKKYLFIPFGKEPCFELENKKLQ